MSRRCRSNIPRGSPRGAASCRAVRFRAGMRGNVAQIGIRFLPMCAARCRAALRCVSLRVAVKLHLIYTHLRCA
eukprot:8963742-Pyramimonas_sp.AAC.1